MCRLDVGHLAPFCHLRVETLMASVDNTNYNFIRYRVKNGFDIPLSSENQANNKINTTYHYFVHCCPRYHAIIIVTIISTIKHKHVTLFRNDVLQCTKTTVQLMTQKKKRLTR